MGSLTFPKPHKLLEELGALSGYKVYPSKSEALPLNMPSLEVRHLSETFLYTWKAHAVKYLSIHLTSHYESLYDTNFKPLFVSISSLMAKWRHYQISWLGLIASIKMTILPKILYCFQKLPVPIPLMQIRKVQADFLNFIWHHKQHRIARSTLFASRNEGGLAFPNLCYYYAAQLRPIGSWATLPAYNRWT